MKVIHLSTPRSGRQIASVVLILALAIAIALSAAFDGLAGPIHDTDKTWVAVARSEDGIQYVAPGSIRLTEDGVLLKSYWQHTDADGAPKAVYYLTEYDCKGRYRDLEAIGQAKDTNWKSIGPDLLNRGAMEYGCARRGSD
ncbi:MAG: hypothetical protein ACFB4J_07980 [Elainellaceae cyanobacterium]